MSTAIQTADRRFLDYPSINAETLGTLVDEALGRHDAVIQSLMALSENTVENTLLVQERADAELGVLMGAVGHLSAVADTPAYREAFNATQPRVSAYFARLNQNERLLAAIERVASDPTASDIERRAIALTARGFKLSGVDLPEAERRRFAEISTEISEVTTAFANAVMDATQAWTRPLDEPMLAGLPNFARELLAAAAAERGGTGWLATLSPPVTQAILTYAEDRELRAEVYRASATRASDQGPNAGEFDNGDRMARILSLRRESSSLLGFPDFVASSLSTKMATDHAQILEFLDEMAALVRPAAERELATLRSFAAEELGIGDLQSWDLAFASERLRQKEHSIDEEEITRYFPVDKVIEGLNRHLEDVFGVSLMEDPVERLWHPDVRHFLVLDGVRPIAHIIFDLYSRMGKQGGAWMNDARSRIRGATDVLPIAYLTTNFAPPSNGRPTLLRHQEVVLLFHEFGHCLHHILTEVDLPSIGGMGGFEWDAVELPSQFHESFAWDPAVLRSVSANVDTGAPLPEDLIRRMLAARDFQAGMALMRQIQFSVLDLELHLLAEPDADTIIEVAKTVRDRYSPIDTPDWIRFPHSFSHIFAGGYAAGYYSYLWAERMSADAYEAFLAVDADRQSLGRRFRREVLARGATRPAHDSYVAFRGAEPDSGALLRQRGLAA